MGPFATVRFRVFSQLEGCWSVMKCYWWPKMLQLGVVEVDYWCVATVTELCNSYKVSFGHFMSHVHEIGHLNHNTTASDHVCSVRRNYSGLWFFFFLCKSLQCLLKKKQKHLESFRHLQLFPNCFSSCSEQTPACLLHKAALPDWGSRLKGRWLRWPMRGTALRTEMGTLPVNKQTKKKHG